MAKRRRTLIINKWNGSDGPVEVRIWRHGNPLRDGGIDNLVKKNGKYAWRDEHVLTGASADRVERLIDGMVPFNVNVSGGSVNIYYHF